MVEPTTVNVGGSGFRLHVVVVVRDWSSISSLWSKDSLAGALEQPVGGSLYANMGFLVGLLWPSNGRVSVVGRHWFVVLVDICGVDCLGVGAVNGKFGRGNKWVNGAGGQGSSLLC